eukprot:Lankesteria_metandrocarpae@DN5320_c0_g3_i1.p1
MLVVMESSSSEESWTQGGGNPKRQTPPFFSMHDWNKNLDAVAVCEDTLDQLVLNYFVVMGWEDVALTLMNEANVNPQIPLAAWQSRREAKEAVLDCRIADARKHLDNIDPKIMMSNVRLDFELKTFELRRIFDASGVGPALTFAQVELADCVKRHPDLLPKLEETMTLFVTNIVKETSPETTGSASGLHPSEDDLKIVAARVDAAILDSFGVDLDPSIVTMLKDVTHSEALLESKFASFPKVHNFEKCKFRESRPPKVLVEIMPVSTSSSSPESPLTPSAETSTDRFQESVQSRAAQRHRHQIEQLFVDSTIRRLRPRGGLANIRLLSSDDPRAHLLQWQVSETSSSHMHDG